MTYCRICGDENGAAFRARSRMTLCASCHRDTPRKATLRGFLRETGMPYSTYSDQRIAAEFYSDYKSSTFSSVADYWRACSA